MSPLPLINSNVIVLAKAFDKVDHSILEGRLSIGVSEGSLAWFANYLSQRVQCLSPREYPKGSILGPTLFSIYINNIAQAVASSLIHLYAEDSLILSWFLPRCCV